MNFTFLQSSSTINTRSTTFPVLLSPVSSRKLLENDSSDRPCCPSSVLVSRPYETINCANFWQVNVVVDFLRSLQTQFQISICPDFPTAPMLPAKRNTCLSGSILYYYRSFIDKLNTEQHNYTWSVSYVQYNADQRHETSCSISMT